jgi:hypothetical protein
MRGGLHFLCLRQEWNRSISVQFERATYLGSAGYHRGTIASFAGLTLAGLSRTLADADFIMSPFLAISFPYWSLVTVSGGLLLWFLLRRGIRTPSACQNAESGAGPGEKCLPIAGS